MNFKTFYLVAMLAAMIPACAMSQQKKDSRITVTADTAGIMDRIAVALYNNGYTITQRDDRNKFIASGVKVLKAGFPASIQLRALVKDNTVLFTGDFRLDLQVGGLTPAFEPIRYGGSKKSVQRLAWDDMYSVAKSIGQTVSYSK